MDSRPPHLLLLLLTSLLHLWQCARGQSSYIIDAVGLTILPSSTVQSGTWVTLRCQVSVSHDNIPHLTHTFHLTRDDVPVHSSTTTEDSVEYELSPARAADSGYYECRVTVKDKSRASFSKKLEVTGLQTPVLYVDKTTPYESEEFIVACSAPEEKGSLIFRFYQRFRSGESQKIKQPASTGNSSETTLSLRKVGDSFLYCDYEINLVSGPRRSNRSREIPVIVKGLYISPIMNVLPSSTVFEGDVMEVVCKVVSPLKNIEVFLTKDRRILKQAPVSLSHRFTAQEGDSGELVCKAEWGNVQKETYQAVTVKELFSKPRLTVEPVDIFERDRFKLTCSVSIYVPERINNDTMRFSIYRDNLQLTSAETYITVADPAKNGNYTCKAQAASLTSSFEKESQTVVVKAKVPVSKPVLSVVGGTLVLGKRFQLLCHSDSGTLPIVYTLYGPNRLLEVKAVSKPGEEAIFNSSAVYKSSDLNSFLCHAKNSQHKTTVTESGKLLRSTNIIEPVSRPVLSLRPSMGDVSEGQDVTLVCSVQRGTLPISFTWYHTQTEDALHSQTSKKLEGSYRIKDVRGEHQGKYYCVCTNPANETQQSYPMAITVKMAGWKKGLIAVFCILLILALILVLIFKRRLLQFKRKTTGELSVKSANTKVERLSLTQSEVNEAANVTPGMMGKSVWSEHVSGSESDDQNSVISPEKPEPQYTEVQARQADPNRAPVKKGTDTVYSEVRNSKQGVPEQADGGSVEYAQLNHDADHHSDHGNHGHHSDHTDEIDSSVDNNTADHGE
ncbi:platelet endothelial cell adhesion molecule isoform X2 [Chelmon rostratus]|uniref:platelet endothelial cell adhesion molecule isoform X2 n=1 Tax=Chelmon rostratus TaxID=109905 RepID=UPI001BE75455|nr:platelet endothelial cell adhesion molecule isoform X2 [Chelmon rostratus]